MDVAALPHEEARLEGFEPPTASSEDWCSSPLSYRRTHICRHPKVSYYAYGGLSTGQAH